MSLFKIKLINKFKNILIKEKWIKFLFSREKVNSFLLIYFCVYVMKKFKIMPEVKFHFFNEKKNKMVY